MDIERMKKVNALIHELQKHGIASSSDDAAVKAEEFLKLGEKIIPDTERHQVAVAQVARDELQLQIEQVKRAINNLANDLQSIKLEISQLSKTVLSQSSSIESLKDYVPRSSGQQTITVQPASRVDPAPVSSAPKEAHPRQGNFTPEDVAIDKFFYYGTKK